MYLHRMSEAEIQQEYAILERSKRNPRAFGELYERYFDRIFNFIYRQIDDEDVTADLCSQTFLSALRNVNRYEFRGVPFSAWLYRIASNEVNKYYRKKKRDNVFSLEEVRVRELIEQAHEAWDEEIVQKLLVYLKSLPTDMLQVLELRFFEDKDFKEIAFILDITESGAKMRTYRALDRLRKNFNLRIKYDV
ncbi:sigma-70 family RNA polymerase sigma factor [Fulvivirgaceae bacterium QH1ED-6-2]|jgi:RNA polymerase sigma-70 factor, ECF subfamily|nr:sigma-70 family RNA polymerase sigma factor [Parachryseolinea silvisoli]